MPLRYLLLHPSTPTFCSSVLTNVLTNQHALTYYSTPPHLPSACLLPTNVLTHQHAPYLLLHPSTPPHLPSTHLLPTVLMYSLTSMPTLTYYSTPPYLPSARLLPNNVLTNQHAPYLLLHPSTHTFCLSPPY
jgi:hypothetical protein